MKYDEFCDGVIERNPRLAAVLRKVLRVVKEGGPRSMNVLLGLVQKQDPTGGVIEKMIFVGMLVKIGDRRGALYGTPYQARAAKRIKNAA